MSRTAVAGWLFVAPAVLAIAVFFAVPVVAALAMSFTDFDIYALADLDNLRFVGLGNYETLLSTPLFWRALANTLLLVGIGVPLSIAVSLGAAMLLHSKLARFRTFHRTALFAPVVTTLVAVAVVWRYLLHTRYGLVNYGLGQLGVDPVDWLGDPQWAMPAIVLLSVWKNFGYNMLILVAGLQAIPEEPYEAAELDGATPWQRFRHITLPALGPTLLFVCIMTMLGQFQVFTEPYVMTQGGPLRSTVSVVLLMYEQGFRWWRLGLATAIAFLLFAIMLVGTLLQLRVQKMQDR